MSTKLKNLNNINIDETIYIVTMNDQKKDIFDINSQICAITLDPKSGILGKNAIIITDKSFIPKMKSTFSKFENNNYNISYSKTTLKEVMPVLMLLNFGMIINPIAKDMICIPIEEIKRYCINNQERIFQKNSLNNPAYTDIRVFNAKKQQGLVKMNFIKDLLTDETLYVISESKSELKPIKAFINRLDNNMYLLLFSNNLFASEFCTHYKKQYDKDLSPMKITKKQLLHILNKGNITNCFLNDGHESMPISINDLNIF